MKVKEILELTMTKPVSAIAKEHLTIGEKKLRDTLKEIGCEHHSGKKGWQYEGNPEVLEKSIYEFVPVGRKAKAITNERKNQPSINEIERMKMQIAAATERPTIIRKRSSFDIDVQLMKELKIKAILHDRNVYEIVEEAIRKHLNELD